VTRRDRLKNALIHAGAAIVLVFYPLFRALQLPKDLRHWLVEARLVRDFTAYDRIRRVRWFLREHGYQDEDSLFELLLDDGRVIAIRDHEDGRIQRVLARRGLLPAQPTHLGQDGDELVWIVWILTMGALAILVFALALAC
jgi:hypothetical protein